MKQESAPSFCASAPGKIVLTGEHFVLHGSLAVAAAINRRTTVKISRAKGDESLIHSQGMSSKVFKRGGRFGVVKAAILKTFEIYGRPRHNFVVDISSDIPQGSGLGSSAAVSVATTAAISAFLEKKLSREEIWEISHFAERVAHGNSSGMDTSASLLGGVFTFSKEKGPVSIEVPRPLEILVVFSGKARSTSRLVSRVNLTRKRFPFSFAHLVQSASLLGAELASSLAKGEYERLGPLMDLAQNSLSWVGASTKNLDGILEFLRKSSSGAKITGAGGGGSVIAIPGPGKAKSMLKQISSKYNRSFLTTIPEAGLSWEDQ